MPPPRRPDSPPVFGYVFKAAVDNDSAADIREHGRNSRRKRGDRKKAAAYACVFNLLAALASDMALRALNSPRIFKNGF